jgi:hypothetical protein
MPGVRDFIKKNRATDVVATGTSACIVRDKDEHAMRTQRAVWRFTFPFCIDGTCELAKVRRNVWTQEGQDSERASPICSLL